MPFKMYFIHKLLCVRSQSLCCALLSEYEIYAS